MRDQFSDKADLEKARQIRFQNDSNTLRTIWTGNTNLQQTVKALSTLRGKGYQFSAGEVEIGSAANTEEYAAPFLNFHLHCKVSRGLLKRSDESTLLISVNMDGAFTFSRVGGASKMPVTVTSMNAASNTLNQWLVDLNAHYGFDCINDLNMARDKVEGDRKKTENRPRTPKAA